MRGHQYKTANAALVLIFFSFVILENVVDNRQQIRERFAGTCLCDEDLTVLAHGRAQRDFLDGCGLIHVVREQVLREAWMDAKLRPRRAVEAGVGLQELK